MERRAFDRRRVHARDIFLIPFSLVRLGFVVFWMGGVFPAAGGGFALFGLFFLAIGLYFTFGRFVVDAWMRGGTRYGVTDQRVLIVRTRPSSDFTAIDLKKLPQIQISERSNGTGTIRFGQPSNMFAYGRSGLSMWMPSMDPTPQFIAIDDPRSVFDLIQRTAQTAW